MRAHRWHSHVAALLLVIAAYETASYLAQRSGFSFARPGDPPWVDTFPRMTRIALLLAAVPWVWTWVTSVVLLRRTTACGFGRVLTLALVLPIAWIVLPVLIIGSTVAGCVMIAIVLASFTS